MSDFDFDYNFDLGQLNNAEATGLDAYFATQPSLITPHGVKVEPKVAKTRVRLASLQQLNGFVRVSSETLIHHSTNELWSIAREPDGFYIERLFRDDGNPVKG